MARGNLVSVGVSGLLVWHWTRVALAATSVGAILAGATGVSVLAFFFFLQQDISALQQSFMSQQASEFWLLF